jgi:hypothetical protein
LQFVDAITGHYSYIFVVVALPLLGVNRVIHLKVNGIPMEYQINGYMNKKTKLHMIYTTGEAS